VVSIAVLAIFDLGLLGFPVTLLNVGMFVFGFSLAFLLEMIESIKIPVLTRTYPDDPTDLAEKKNELTVEWIEPQLEGRLHQISRSESSWGHAIDKRTTHWNSRQQLSL